MYAHDIIPRIVAPTMPMPTATFTGVVVPKRVTSSRIRNCQAVTRACHSSIRGLRSKPSSGVTYR